VTVHERALVALLAVWSTLIVTFFIDVVFAPRRSRVFRVELPSEPSRAVFLKAHLLEPVVRGRGGGLGGNRPRRPGPMNEHTHHHR